MPIPLDTTLRTLADLCDELASVCRRTAVMHAACDPEAMPARAAIVHAIGVMNAGAEETITPFARGMRVLVGPKGGPGTLRASGTVMWITDDTHRVVLCDGYAASDVVHTDLLTEFRDG